MEVEERLRGIEGEMKNMERALEQAVRGLRLLEGCCRLRKSAREEDWAVYVVEFLRMSQRSLAKVGVGLADLKTDEVKKKEPRASSG